MMAKKKRSVAPATRRFRLYHRTGGDLRNQVKHHPQVIPRVVVYNDLTVLSVDTTNTITTETRRQADILFDKKIKAASVFKSSKVSQKKSYWQQLYHTTKRAMHAGGCIMYSRNVAHPEYSEIRLQVILAAVEGGLLYEHRSPKGSPKMSRLLPMPVMNEYAQADPWSNEPNEMKRYVYIVRREDKTDIPFDFSKLHSGHIALDYQDRLELINKVNRQYEITHELYSAWEQDFAGRRQLRPVHYVRFTEKWEWHGRLYTGQYGHQSLRKIERRTIEFNGCPCVELDYSGHHTRILYHLLNIDYSGDPYALWGKNTTKPQRQLAKTLINIALNAKDRKTTIAQCNLETSTKTQKEDKRTKKIVWQRKQGKSLEKALLLLYALKETKETFAQIYDLAIHHHKPIARFFGNDSGIWLMRIDSAIAIDIMTEFAKQAIPCLCCHDSFIVPEHHGQQLREFMNKWYYRTFRRYPVIK